MVDLDVSVGTIAEHLAVSEQSVRRRLNGAVTLGLTTVLDICEIVGIEAGATLSAAEEAVKLAKDQVGAETPEDGLP